ncbi:unnamed protein product, partial [Larinioides sclopetarius]
NRRKTCSGSNKFEWSFGLYENDDERHPIIFRVRVYYEDIYLLYKGDYRRRVIRLESLHNGYRTLFS